MTAALSPPIPVPPNSAYLRLEETFKRIELLREMQRQLDWDKRTMMPSGGSVTRGEQLALIATLRQETLNGSEVADLLDAAEADSDELDPWEAANLREMRHWWRHETAIPASLAAEQQRVISVSEAAWVTARQDNNFNAFRPHLEAQIAITRQIADAKAGALGLSPYDALHDAWEPGGRQSLIDPLFDQLAAELPGLIDAIIDHQSRQPAAPDLAGPFPIAAQTALSEDVMRRIGFDFAHGRLDPTVHPFCSGAPDDQRITTRFRDSDFTLALMATIHETGHALYESGRPRGRWRYQPVGRARGSALHESQSLIVEMQAARSDEFLGFLPHLLRQYFGDHAGFAPDALRRLYRRVQRSFIRVEADEATYPLHVVLRYRLEKAMLAGDLAVADLPDAWREGFRALVGAEVPDDRLGCLQDIHWAMGYFGYFPTYSLGAVTAAQLFAAATRDDPGILPALAHGNFAPLVAWLRQHVHGLGSRYSTEEIVCMATGAPVSADAFLAHIRTRYLAG